MKQGAYRTASGQRSTQSFNARVKRDQPRTNQANQNAFGSRPNQANQSASSCVFKKGLRIGLFVPQAYAMGVQGCGLHILSKIHWMGALL